jgi:hypothetical protein
MLGILTFALFPFALPGLVLVVATGLVLALPLLLIALVGALLAGAWFGIRAAGRGISRTRRELKAPETVRDRFTAPRPQHAPQRPRSET